MSTVMRYLLGSSRPVPSVCESVCRFCINSSINTERLFYAISVESSSFSVQSLAMHTFRLRVFFYDGDKNEANQENIQLWSTSVRIGQICDHCTHFIALFVDADFNLHNKT